jgi:hypothetical protein
MEKPALPTNQHTRPHLPPPTTHTPSPSAPHTPASRSPACSPSDWRTPPDTEGICSCCSKWGEGVCGRVKWIGGGGMDEEHGRGSRASRFATKASDWDSILVGGRRQLLARLNDSHFEGPTAPLPPCLLLRFTSTFISTSHAYMHAGSLQARAAGNGGPRHTQPTFQFSASALCSLCRSDACRPPRCACS